MSLLETLSFLKNCNFPCWGSTQILCNPLNSIYLVFNFLDRWRACRWIGRGAQKLANAELRAARKAFPTRWTDWCWYLFILFYFKFIFTFTFILGDSTRILHWACNPLDLAHKEMMEEEKRNEKENRLLFS